MFNNTLGSVLFLLELIKYLPISFSYSSQEQIIKLGIEQQYDFVGHITLGYFDKVDDNGDRDQIELKITEINDQLVAKSLPVFKLNQWELRKFTDMTNFIREKNWGSIKIGN